MIGGERNERIQCHAIQGYILLGSLSGIMPVDRHDMLLEGFPASNSNDPKHSKYLHSLLETIV